MTEPENVDQFMTRVMGIVNQIRLTGEDIPDQRIVEKVLKSLPNKFEIVLTTILESKDLSNFSTDELMGSLLTHETRLHLEDESIANAFKTQFSINKGRGKGRGRGNKGRGRSPSNQHSGEGHTYKKGIRITSLKEGEGGDPMNNQAYNSITSKCMDTMNLNAGRSRQINTQAEHMSQIMKETPMVGCFFPVTTLKNNTRISSCWTMDTTIIWQVKKKYFLAFLLLFH
jgi:hypothetical protein